MKPLAGLGLAILLVVLFNVGMHPGVFNLATSLLAAGAIVAGAGAAVLLAWRTGRL